LGALAELPEIEACRRAKDNSLKINSFTKIVPLEHWCAASGTPLALSGMRRETQDQTLRWIMMNFKNTLRVHTILLGLGAALLLGSAARAQQEMDPTPFDDGPFVTTFAQPTPAPATMTLASATPIETNSLAVPMAVQATEASIVSNVDTSEWTTLAGWAMIAFVIAIALFVRRKIAPVNPAARQNRGLSTAKIHAL
jgi:hypothetical protein